MTLLMLSDTPAQVRRRFVNNVADAVGRSNVRAFYLPSDTEGLTAPDQVVASRVWTHGATPTGRLSKLGKGTALAFNGTSDYISTPDAADLSFGNSSVDSPFSVFAAVKVTDTANYRILISKDDAAGSAREWAFYIDNADLLTLALFDQSVPASPSRASNAAITQGSWTSVGASYDATGGATAANGMALYQNGAVLASTATNAGTYVAMENLGQACLIGASQATPSSFFQGLLGMVLLANFSAAQHAQLTQLSRSYGLVA